MGKNIMLDRFGVLNTHVGLFDESAAVTAITGTASTDVFAKTSHGFTNGDLIVLTEMSGGAGLIAGDAGNANGLAEPLYIITANANDFQVSRTSGGSAVNFTSDITAVKATELIELSGGAPAYARKSIAYNAAALGTMDDSTNGAVFDVGAGATVDYVGFWSASSGGTLYAIDKVTAETFGGQGTYTLTDADLDLNA
jgi:hypothetical protein